MRASTYLITAGLILFFVTIVSATPAYNPTNGHYYEMYGCEDTWDQADAAARDMTYLDMPGYLMTITTAEEYTIAKGLVTDWTYTWVGATVTDGVGYWINDEGPVNSDIVPWGSSEPGYADYGVAFTGGGYGFDLRAYSSTYQWGNMIVEYAPVPEPATLGLLAGGATLLAWRRKKRK